MTFQSFVTIIITLNWAFAFAQTHSDVIESDSQNAKLVVGQGHVKTSTSESDQKKQKKDQNVEKIEVTGSFVRRIDVEGPSPVVTVNKEDFEKAGIDTVTDYMRENPMFSGSTDSGNRDGYFQFRGQHAGSTLILINGMRLPKLGGTGRGFYTGVESIPTGIIERVEILKDGSSALYGSDAMAGVMNFITKKDYDGAEYSSRVNVPEIGEGLQQNHSLAFGKSYARGNWFVSTQFVEQRGYTQKDVGNYYNVPTVGGLSNSTITPLTKNGPNSYTAGESTFVQGDCQDPSSKNCPANDTRGSRWIRDPRKNLGTMVSGRYELTNDISVSMVGIYNRRQRMRYGLPNYLNYTRQNNQTLFHPSVFSKGNLAPAVAGADATEVVINPLQEIGNSKVATLENSYSAQAKVEGFYFDTWEWNLTGSYAYSKETNNHLNGLVSLDQAASIINSNAWSPSADNTGAFDSARVQGVEAYFSSMTNTRLLTTGELFSLSDWYSAGGAVSLAAGLEGQWATTGDDHDLQLYQQPLNTPFFSNQQGSRSVRSAFMELVAYPLSSLEVQIAGRSDSYSDFGSTFNPKFSMGYRPSKKILLRGSWGTNFNAPSVRNMIQRNFVDYQTIQICPNNESDCATQNIPVTRYRDPNLHPETAVNYNLGTVIQPNKHWTFTFDQWNFVGNGMLAARSGMDYSNLFNSLGGDFKALEDQAGVTFQRNSKGEIISASFPAVRNMGTRIIRGIDLNIAFNSPVRIFGKVLKMKASSNHTHMLTRKTKYTDYSPFTNYTDMQWKNITSLTLSSQRHSTRLAARTLPGTTTVRSQTRMQTVYDINYNYQIPFWAAHISIGVKNLLDSRPNTNIGLSYVNYASGYNASQIQPLGRRYYVGYRQTF